MYPQRMVRQVLWRGLPVPFGVAFLVLLLALAVAGCSFGEGGSEASQKKLKAPEGTFDLPNGRSLYMKCLGSGSPTILLEARAAAPGVEMFEVQEGLARQYMTCTY